MAVVSLPHRSHRPGPSGARRRGVFPILQIMCNRMTGCCMNEDSFMAADGGFYLGNCSSLTMSSRLKQEAL
jgi:hypothetical protein